MLAQLVVISGPDQGRTFSLEEGQTLVLGRGETASARLNDPFASRSHCRVEVDCRSDIYSLGATVYALLTGHPPFEGESLPEVITRIRQEEPEKPKKSQLSIPDLFEGIVLRMLAKRPADRRQTPKDLLKDMDRVATYQGIELSVP